MQEWEVLDGWLVANGLWIQGEELHHVRRHVTADGEPEIPTAKGLDFRGYLVDNLTCGAALRKRALGWNGGFAYFLMSSVSCIETLFSQRANCNASLYAEGEGAFSCSPQASFGEGRGHGVFPSWRSVPVFRSVSSSREFRQGGSRVSRRSQCGLSGALGRSGLPQTLGPKKEVLITGKGVGKQLTFWLVSSVIPALYIIIYIDKTTHSLVE
jgi:hypothetical protein